MTRSDDKSLIAEQNFAHARWIALVYSSDADPGSVAVVRAGTLPF